ncbi:MAG: class I SAM-dependent DNA methyltransferase [Bdellovibrionales bacterium]|jgi:type I restriction enzyme M protein
MNQATIVNKVWGFATVLQQSGVAYTDYVMQFTYLLFLKMDEEREELANEGSLVPAKYRWKHLKRLTGDELVRHYRDMLETLATGDGLLRTIYSKAQNKINEPARLQRLIQLIDEETWLGLDMDIKGAIYEGLLSRNAEESKAGAGQYFTPRPLIRAMVDVMRPQPTMTVCDPACGTGGFLLAAYDFMRQQTQERKAILKLQNEKLHGSDITEQVAALCAMNMYLHGISGACIESGKDALLMDDGNRYDMVLANPPFGKKSSYTIVGDDGKSTQERENYERDDFKVTTSNKQLNFLQHIMTILKVGGTAAVVLPDNVLFEAGAGEKLRKRLLNDFDLHTILRLPTGIFYKQGVKANVLFFDKKPAATTPWTKETWVFDFRTNMHFTLVERPLQREDLNEFVAAYKPESRTKRKETERFKCFTYAELAARDKLNLDIFWLKDDSLEDVDNLPAPDIIAAEIVDNLEAALEQFRGVAEQLQKTEA